ncbi:Methyladenine glycosylase [Parasponia andersonii]|uniref:Methyladenine glycosylase n=1 Tax=Parasponia andersonii TaxID=3476 RepID=A0A2P5AB16_PARAD|nr:Methyladenine glycosylase [Parasponia andersonii]
MSVATKLQSPVCETRSILGPGGNRARVSEDSKRKGEDLNKPQRTTMMTRKLVPEVPQSVVRNNGSVDSSCSSDSSSSGSSAKTVSSKKTVRRKGFRPVKIVPDGVEAAAPSPRVLGPPKRCDWITPNSDPIYTSFHDEEWGVPVHEDEKLFELLVFSQALAELTWPAILNKRDIFRKLFDKFDPSSVAQFNEKKLLSLKVNGSLVLAEPKLRAIVENAKQMLKVQQEFGSFSNYCWAFVNHKPIRNGFRYARQVPVKSPKADLISKDMMQRGFRCVGPTVIYSFMQVAGIVNDHLLACFRYGECNLNVKKDLKPKTEEPERLIEALEKKTNLSI